MQSDATIEELRSLKPEEAFALVWQLECMKEQAGGQLFAIFPEYFWITAPRCVQ